MIKAFLEQGGAKTDAQMAEYIAGMDGMVALASIYVPLDGMNEKGLCKLAETHESPLTGESVKRFAMLSERYAGLRCLLSRRTLQQTYTLTADGMNRCHSVLNSICFSIEKHRLQSSETLSILRRSIPEGV